MNRNFKEGEPNPTLIRILWVDDEAFERVEPNELLLKGLNGEIEYVLSGKKALEILERKVKDGTLPDLVISDFNMPGMNGLEFVEAVRAHEDERIKSLPICIVSGFVYEEDKARLEELGIPVFNFEDAFHEPQKIRQVYEESKRRD
ncbi:response regulator [Patescibacteria group bacterium]|nr:response regulator [Patescibacteria group bacterium]